MRNIYPLVIALLFLNIGYAQIKQYTYSDTTYNSAEFSEITFTLHKKTGDTLMVKGLLKSYAVLNEIPCKGNITLTKGMNLKRFTLAGDCKFGTHTFPPDTYIELDIDLSRSSDINSLDNYLAIRNAGSQILYLCYFPFLQVIDGISCSGNKSVFFKNDWSLKGCILAEDDTVKGNLLPEGTFIRFDKDSSMACFCPADPEIQGYRCAGTDYTGAWMGGGGIFFYPGGALKRFQPVDTVTIRGVVCKRSSVRGGVTLYENGSLRKCTCARDQTIDGIICKENYTLKFDENGKLIYAQKEKFF
jgi:hypothetical protein